MNNHELYDILPEAEFIGDDEQEYDHIEPTFIESNMYKHAMREFKAAGWNDSSDDMQESIMEDVLDLLEVINSQGHSGSSFPYMMNILNTLAKFKPLSPLSGDDSEWVDHEYCYQNNRCSSVFKDKETGRTYNIDGKVFWNWELYEGERFKSYYTNGDSRVDITFPYTPPDEPEYIHKQEDDVC